VFNSGQVLDITWPDAPSEAFYDNASYRVSLRQYEFGVPVEEINSRTPFKELIVGHHWASDVPSNFFKMGPFGFDVPVCYGCVSYITIIPEVYTTVGQGAYTTYEYTPVQPPVLPEDMAAQFAFDGNNLVSEPFVMERDLRNAKAKEDDDDEGDDDESVCGQQSEQGLGGLSYSDADDVCAESKSDLVVLDNGACTCGDPVQEPE